MSKLPFIGRVPTRAGQTTGKIGQSSTTKIGTISLDRTVAQSAEPANTTGESDHRTFVDTYFTKIPVVGQPEDIVYNGDRTWAKLTLTLETAGPVAVGNLEQIRPVLSGKGQLLETDVPAVFYIGKGTRLYIAATGVNRVKRVIEPVPWLETITGLVGTVIGSLRGTAVAVAVAAAARSKI